MAKETMTPRDRWLAVLRRETPDRVPMDYWGTGEATAKLVRHLGCETPAEVFAKLHIDAPAGIAPRYAGPPLEPGVDMFGCRMRTVEYDGGSYSECIFHPLAAYSSVAEIEANYTWPSADWFDFSVLPDQVRGNEHRPVKGGGSEPFLIYKNLRGQEQAFMDLVLNPDMVKYCLDKLYGLAYEMTRRIFETVPKAVLFSYVAEDLGGQEALMYSPDQIREFFFPWMRKMIDLVHDAGAFVFHHTDGAVRDIIPDLIGIGIDVLNPIQWRCHGMDRRELKRDFGDRLIFHGGVDNQHTLAFGTVEEVREEVAFNLRVLGRDGGYILAPCHNIQVISPPENIVAMYETGYELGTMKTT